MNICYHCKNFVDMSPRTCSGRCKINHIDVDYVGTCELYKEERRNKTMSDYNYEKNNCTRVSIKLGNKTDADIIEQLNKQENKQGYIKQLIRDDISVNKC